MQVHIHDASVNGGSAAKQVKDAHDAQHQWNLRIVFVQVECCLQAQGLQPEINQEVS